MALKITTAESYGGENEIYELDILRHIKTANPGLPGHKHVLCLVDEFRHAGPHGVHVCLVFEVMGEDLVALARRYSDQKLPIHLVKQISRQLLLGLDYLTQFMQGRAYGSVVPLHTKPAYLPTHFSLQISKRGTF